MENTETISKQSYKQSYTDNVELSIFNCGHECCQPGYTWGPGVRDHYLIHLVVAGRGLYQVGGVSFPLQPGDLFLAKPNQLITYAADETDPWEYYWVGFNGACANKLVQAAPFTDARPVHRCKDPQMIRDALFRIYESRGPEPQCEALMTGYLSQMESFGEKYLAPLAPHYPHNGDIVVRLPLFMQTRTLFTVALDSWLQRTRRAQRPWRKRA